MRDTERKLPAIPNAVHTVVEHLTVTNVSFLRIHRGHAVRSGVIADIENVRMCSTDGRRGLLFWVIE